MIKIKTVGTQMDNVVLNFEFDDADKKSQVATINIPLNSFIAMSEDDIKKAVVERVAISRASLAVDTIQSMAKKLVDVDLEVSEVKL
jgi:hypothetical protein